MMSRSIYRPGREGNERGYSLLEVLLALALIFIIFTAVSSLNTTAWKYWDKNQEKIDLKQQARVITKFLDRDIRAAVDMKTADSNGDGRRELYLNLGDYQGPGDDTDNFTDYYIKYEISGDRLVFRKTDSTFNVSGVCFPHWPTAADWGVSRSITMEIIQDYSLSCSPEPALVSYLIKLSQNGEYYRLEGKIHPRVLGKDGEGEEL